MPLKYVLIDVKVKHIVGNIFFYRTFYFFKVNLPKFSNITPNMFSRESSSLLSHIRTFGLS